MTTTLELAGAAKAENHVAACWNLLLKALRGDGSNAPSPVGLDIDGSPMPLGSTAIHEPIGIPKSLWAGWKSLEAIKNNQNNPLGTN